MSTRRFLSLATAAIALGAALSSHGCGGFSDGGTVGTGRVSTIAGNVVDDAGGPRPGITVSLAERPDLLAATDDAGNFMLEGDFAGALTLRFAGAAVDASQPLEVPSGAAIALSEVEVDADGVEVDVGRQLGFLGVVVSADCGAGNATVHDLRGPDARFTVRISSDTALVRGDGSPASCADLLANTRVEIDSVFDPTEPETITAEHVVVGTTLEQPPRERARTIAFTGIVTRVECEKRRLFVADAGGLTRVRLGDATTLVRPGGRAIECGDVEPGNQVTGLGVLRLDDPSAIRAQTLVVARQARPDLLLLFIGRLGEIDCATNTLQVLKNQRVTTVRLTTETELVGASSCATLRLRDRVRGRGRADVSDPQTVVATRLTVRRPASDD